MSARNNLYQYACQTKRPAPSEEADWRRVKLKRGVTGIGLAFVVSVERRGEYARCIRWNLQASVRNRSSCQWRRDDRNERQWAWACVVVAYSSSYRGENATTMYVMSHNFQSIMLK